MHPTIARSIAAGFVATLAMTIMMYTTAPMMGLNMDIAAMLGSLLGGSWTAGMVLHFINGSIIFPLIYALVLYRFLPGGPIGKGVIWGVVLWLLAQTIVMPMMGGGFFSARMGGMMAVFGSLMGHLFYGGLLGGIAGAPRPAPAAAS
jgi:uncharacterized membrane protein YagU involved in acid resistance